MHVMFYTKPGCSLCDEAEQMMRLIQEEYPLTWTTVNIEEDDAKHEQYMFLIPVIEQEDKVLCSGVIGYADLVMLVDSEV